MAKKRGQPTKYKDQYCMELIEHMSQGYSFESFAAVVDVNIDTIYEWAKVQPLFSEAKKKAFVKSQLFWEKIGIDGLWSSKDRSLNTGVYCFQMKNRFGWKDRIEQDVTAKEIKIVISKDEENL